MKGGSRVMNIIPRSFKNLLSVGFDRAIKLVEVTLHLIDVSSNYILLNVELDFTILTR